MEAARVQQLYAATARLSDPAEKDSSSLDGSAAAGRNLLSVDATVLAFNISVAELQHLGLSVGEGVSGGDSAGGAIGCTVSYEDFAKNIRDLLRLSPEEPLLPALEQQSERVAELRQDIDACMFFFNCLDTDHDGVITLADTIGVMDSGDATKLFTSPYADANCRYKAKAWAEFCVSQLFRFTSFLDELLNVLRTALTKEEREEVWRLYRLVDGHCCGSFNEGACVRAFGPEGASLYAWVHSHSSSSSGGTLLASELLPKRASMGQWETAFRMVMENLGDFRQHVAALSNYAQTQAAATAEGGGGEGAEQQPARPITVHISAITCHGSRRNLHLLDSDTIESLKEKYEEQVNCPVRWLVQDGEGLGEREVARGTLAANGFLDLAAGVDGSASSAVTIRSIPIGPLTEKLDAEKAAREEKARAARRASPYTPTDADLRKLSVLLERR